MKQRRVIVLSLLAAILVGLILWVVWGNQALELNAYTITSDSLPDTFSGFRIAQVSDLHNAEMGSENEKLLAMLREAAPDLIAITGDLIDSRRTDIDLAIRFVEQAAQIAPCYYVTGNHEARLTEVEHADFEHQLVEVGVTVLHDDEVTIARQGQQISLIGIDDPDFAEKHGGVGLDMNPKHISELSTVDTFTVLLSHRPEFFQQYVQSGTELILSGHAHGGQIRLPLIGGLFAPNQGIFPEYDAGLYAEGSTNLIVSRGIGNSLFPFRINNRPEVILIELQQG